MRRPNLRVEIRALAHRVLFEGKRAVGVEYQPGRDRAAGAGAARGVALRRLDQLAAAAAASGIGPGQLLQEHGIAVVHDLPGVGENLQDHIDSRVDLSRAARQHVERDLA